MPPEPATLGILLLSGEYERAHYAFMVAVAAASVARPVVVFATNWGCHALAADWTALRGAGRPAAEQDGEVRARGVAGLDELREAAGELGVVLSVCDAGLRVSGVTEAELVAGVAVTGIPAFLGATTEGQVLTF